VGVGAKTDQFVRIAIYFFDSSKSFFDLTLSGSPRYAYSPMEMAGFRRCVPPNLISSFFEEIHVERIA